MDYLTVVRSICLQPYAAECRFGLKIHNDLEEMYMLIVTKEKEVELKLKTRLMLLLEERLHIEDTQLFWQKAAQAGNIRVLTTAVLILSDGALKKLEDAADLLDAYLEENSEASVQNLYVALLTEINERGFSAGR